MWNKNLTKIIASGVIVFFGFALGVSAQTAPNTNAAIRAQIGWPQTTDPNVNLNEYWRQQSGYYTNRPPTNPATVATNPNVYNPNVYNPPNPPPVNNYPPPNPVSYTYPNSNYYPPPNYSSPYQPYNPFNYYPNPYQPPYLYATSTHPAIYCTAWSW